MKILVANLGSTSFKYRLFDMADERQLARGGVERIGAPESRCFVEIGGSAARATTPVPDHAAAVRMCLEQLTAPGDGCLADAAEVSAIGFKAVHGGRISGVQRVNADVLAAMEEMSRVAPAHNPPYIDGHAALEREAAGDSAGGRVRNGLSSDGSRSATATTPCRMRGLKSTASSAGDFTGPAIAIIATRTAELLGSSDLRIISCHLGGSNSLCAVRAGESVATTLGMSPQSGLAHNNRVGDFDPFALPVVMERTGKTLNEVLDDLAERSGLLGLSGLSGDVRDLEEAAAKGNQRARLALDVFVGGHSLSLGGHCSSNWAAPTRSCSPAASAKTA